MKPFDPTKPCRTMDGREVVIYKVYPQQKVIHGAIEEEEKSYIRSWNMNGTSYWNVEKENLINIPAKIKFEFWVNLYKNGELGGNYMKEHEAARSNCSDGFAVTKKFSIEVDESEFASEIAPKTPVPQKIIRWTNITKSHGEYVAIGIYHSKQDAIDHAYNNNEQIKIEFDEF